MTIYHITTQENWTKALAKGLYDFDALATEGFIHCSTDTQVLEVANRIFKGRTDLLLLVIDEEKVGPKVVSENLEGGEEMYPHIYGPLNTDAVEEAREFQPDESGSFLKF